MTTQTEESETIAFATRNERPFEHGVDGKRESQDASDEPADQGEHAHWAFAGTERGINSMVERGRAHRHVRDRRVVRHCTERCGGSSSPRGRVEDAKDVDIHRARLRAQVLKAQLQTSDLVISLISVIEIPGKFLMNRRNSRKNQAKLPVVIAASTQVGRYAPTHSAGSKLCASELTMMTKRSEPHADVHENRDDEQGAQVRPHLLPEERQRHQAVAERPLSRRTARTRRWRDRVNVPQLEHAAAVAHAMKNSVAYA